MAAEYDVCMNYPNQLYILVSMAIGLHQDTPGRRV